MTAKLPPLFLINLKRDEKKRALMRKQLDALSIPYEIIDGVFGQDLSTEYLDKVSDPDKACHYIGRALTKAEVGCYLSHLEAMQAIVDSNAPYGVIIEDDVIINCDYIPVLLSIQKLPLDWQIIQLGNAFNGHKCVHWFRKKHALANGYSLSSLLPRSWGTQAYLITKELCQRILSEPYPIFCPIDHCLFDIYLSFSFFHALKGKQLFEHDLQSESAIQKEREVINTYSFNAFQKKQSKQKFLPTLLHKINSFLFSKLLSRLEGLWIYIRPVPPGAHKPPVFLSHSSATRSRLCAWFIFRLLR
ncbi:MAG: glycosyltransferase family 25 protein [Candidatus Oxydemutatoraceae bacterium WSBS_2016_MAG_OTU14]